MGKHKLVAMMVAAAWLGGCSVSSLDDMNLASANLGKDAAVLGEDAAGSVAATPTAQTPVVGAPISTGSIGSAAMPADADATARLKKVAAEITAVADPKSAAYKIGPMDVLDISVFKVPELSKSLQVSSVGTVNLPLIGERAAAGHTARELEQDLTREWGAKYLQNPQVTVFVKEYNSQRITIQGAVKKAGVYPIQGRMTLMQAIATAQGLDKNSDSQVLVFRTEDGKRAAARFNIEEIHNGASPDPQLSAGDVVVVGTSATKEAFNNVLKIVPLASFFLLL
jgi:polysaccharide export outer membrane protein